MKLLFFASDYKIGLSALLVDEAIALHRLGVPILCLTGEGEQEPGLKDAMCEKNVPLLIINGLDAHYQFHQLAYQIKEIIEEYEITHIHVQNNWQLAIMAYVKFILRIPRGVKILYTLHGFRHNNFFKSIVARLLIGCMLWLVSDHIICMCRYLQSVFWPLKYKSVLLPLGVSDVLFDEYYPPSIKDHGLQIIYPAQFRLGKNQELVIKSFADYLKNTGDTKAHLWLPGSGKLLDKMKNLVSSLSLQNRICFPGQCSKAEIVELYHKCNVAVVASNRETFGQSIVEPWVMGLIVLSRPVGIAPDIIISGENGFLFNNHEDLTSLWTQLATHAEMQEKIMTNTRKKRKLFFWDEVAKQYKKLLTTVDNN